VEAVAGHARGHRPTHLAIIFDKSEITFRNKLYPTTRRTGRPAPGRSDPAVRPDRDAVRAFDLPCLEQSASRPTI